MHISPISYYEYASKGDLLTELSKDSLLEKVNIYIFIFIVLV